MSKQKIVGIYKITSPSGKVYIGQSVNIDLRRDRYKRGNCKSQIKVYNSIVKYGWDNHIFELVETCEHDQLNIRERFWQDHYNCVNEGLNCLLTSTDEKPMVMSAETIAKIVKANTGKKQTGERKRKHALINVGRVKTKEHLSNISAALKGTSIPFEVRAKISETLKAGKNANSRIVVDIETGVFFHSVSEAARTYGFKVSTLTQAMQGVFKNKTNLRYA